MNLNLEKLGKIQNKNFQTSVIPNNFEKYISFSLLCKNEERLNVELRFLDSCSFMAETQKYIQKSISLNFQRKNLKF
jgi:hypothetical protein